MLEAFLTQHSATLSNPLVFAGILFFLIVTQIFGVLFNAIVLIVSPFIPPLTFVLIILFAGTSAEIINYFVGRYFSVFFIKRYPKIFKTINNYTNFTTILTGKFVGIPLLSYALGIGKKINIKQFIFPNAIFFLTNAIIITILGNTIPLKYFWIIILVFFIIIGIETYKQKNKKSR